MKVAFLQNFWYEYLGVMSISAVVKKGGHKTRVFINQAEKNLLQAVLLYDPDVICFPTYSGSQGWVLKKALKFKKKTGKLIVLGGPHATFFPEIVKEKGVDIVCRGEGEYPVVELLDALKKWQRFDKIKNLWVKKGGRVIKNPLRRLIDPLDKLPLLDREVYYRYRSLAHNRVKNFNIGRGCPFRCAYCHNAGLAKIYKGKGRYLRYHSQERVLQEIEMVRKKYPLKVVYFIDDTFTANKKWLKRFLLLYKKKIDLPFVCNIRADLLDKELARGLSRAGCISVFMGVETGNEKMRIKLLNKQITNKQFKKTAQLLHQYKIYLAANNMIGLPGESLEEALETLRFNTEIKVDLPWCAIFQPYPGTELTNYCLKKGYVAKKDIDQIGLSFLKRSVLKNKNNRELVNLQKLFHLGVKFPWLVPVIKKLIKLPLTFIYDFIFLINQGLSYKRFFRFSMADFLPHAWYFGWFYLKSKKKN